MTLYIYYINQYGLKININYVSYSKKFEYIDQILRTKKEIALLRETNYKEYEALVDTIIHKLKGLSKLYFSSSKLQGILYKISPKYFMKYVSFISAPSRDIAFILRFLYYLTYCSPAFMCSFDLTEEITTYDPELTAEAEAREKGRRIVGESLTDAMLQNSKNKPDAFLSRI